METTPLEQELLDVASKATEELRVAPLDGLLTLTEADAEAERRVRTKRVENRFFNRLTWVGFLSRYQTHTSLTKAVIQKKMLSVKVGFHFLAALSREFFLKNDVVDRTFDLGDE
jgi:hypothetical protein